MTPWRWLLDRFRRRSDPVPPAAVMHMVGPGFRPTCGTAYGPAAPMTIEPARVECEGCLAVYRVRDRRRVFRHR